MLSAAVFFALALVAFVGALVLVFHRNPMVAAVGMAVAMVGLGVLYMILHVPTRRVRLVRAGDTLPLMCYRIYGSAGYYLEVAAVNGIDNFRKLEPGSRVVFPPLE